MTVITTHLKVAADGTITATDPIPTGEHLATVTVVDAAAVRPGKPFTMKNFPIHDGPWDNSISLRREDMYGDDGR